MGLRRSAARVTGGLAVWVALAAGFPVVVEVAETLSTGPQGPYMTESWVERYRSFLAGQQAVTLYTVLKPVAILVPVAFAHAVWKRSLTVVTLAGVCAVPFVGVLIPAPTLHEPLMNLCPVCRVLWTTVDVPLATLALVAVLLCNLSELLDPESVSEHSRGAGSGSVESRRTPNSRRELSRVLSNVSGHLLVGLFLTISIGSHLSAGGFPDINQSTTLGIGACAVMIYEFVTTNATFALTALTVVTWHAGIAALQYPTSLSEFLLSTAVLLTLSTAATIYADRGPLQG